MTLLRPLILLLMGAAGLQLGMQALFDCNSAVGFAGTAKEKRLQERREQAELVKVIASFPGPVVSDNMTLLLRAGKPVPFEPMIVKLNTDNKIFDERPLVKLISDKFFDALILYSGPGRVSDGVMEALHRNYHSYLFGGGTYMVYVR